MIIKNHLLKTIRSKSTYFLAAVAVLDAVALVLYFNFGTSVFIPKLSPTVIAFMITAIALSVIVAFVGIKLPYVILYAANLFSCFFFLSSQASFIANVFVGIDGTSFSVAFYAIVALTLIAAALTLIAMSFIKEQFNTGSDDQNEGEKQKC